MVRALLVRPALVLAAVALVLVPATARADEGPDDEVRVAGSCTGGAVSELRVRARDDGELRIDLALRSGRAAQRWVVVVVHERRLTYRGAVRAGRSSHRAALRRTVADLFGPDTVSIRASGGPGETCRATGTVGAA
ncbi:MAG TPA: hypothetical protein VGF10_12820 [Gaiella sp.]